MAKKKQTKVRSRPKPRPGTSVKKMGLKPEPAINSIHWAQTITQLAALAGRRISLMTNDGHDLRGYIDRIHVREIHIMGSELQIPIGVELRGVGTITLERIKSVSQYKPRILKPAEVIEQPEPKPVLRRTVKAKKMRSR